MKYKNKEKINCVKTYFPCVEWNLCDLPCLGIKKGDTLDEITFAIVTKLCEVSKPLDLNSVSAQCLVDKLNATLPLNKTVATYLQLLIDNECKLADLVKAMQNQINGITSPSLILDLKCLKVLDSNGNQLPYTQETVLQSLITEACLIRNQIAGLNGAITNLNIRVDNLSDPYTEPLLNSCIYTNRPTSQAVTLLATDYCSFKGLIGTQSQIQTAIGRQPSTLNVDFASNLNFIQNVQNLSQSENNQWVLLSNMYARLKTLEECACKVSCKDVVIGFSTEFTDNNKVILNFTSGAGTYIPIGFKDCGSILTIKNDSGVKTLPINIVISQEGLSQEIDVAMFVGGEYLTFNIDGKLCNGGLSCNQCVSKVVRNTSACCEIKNTGTTSISITYKQCNTSITSLTPNVGV